MYTLRRPLIVSELPLADEIDVQIAKLVDVPWSLHAFERISLAPEPYRAAVQGLVVHAAADMLVRFAPHDRLVLLGPDVCCAFGCPYLDPLATARVSGRAYFHLPIPWPDEAGQALQAFLDGPRVAA